MYIGIYDIDVIGENYEKHSNIDRLKDLFGEEIVCGEITTHKQAAELAEKYWIEIYGHDSIIDQRPYLVEYNLKNDIWYIHGDISGDEPGGVAYAIFDREDGKLLDMWHDE